MEMKLTAAQASVPGKLCLQFAMIRSAKHSAQYPRKVLTRFFEIHVHEK